MHNLMTYQNAFTAPEVLEHLYISSHNLATLNSRFLNDYQINFGTCVGSRYDYCFAIQFPFTLALSAYCLIIYSPSNHANQCSYNEFIEEKTAHKITRHDKHNRWDQDLATTAAKNMNAYLFSSGIQCYADKIQYIAHLKRSDINSADKTLAYAMITLLIYINLQIMFSSSTTIAHIPNVCVRYLET